MNCWMFPGQPLRFEDDFPADPDGLRIAALCRESVGFDPSNPKDDSSISSQHVRLQLYGTATSLHKASRSGASGERPDLVIEHSMGIYAALAACGSVSEREALEITARVGRALTSMSGSATYALGCIVGLPQTPTESVAQNHGVYIANYNTKSHFLLSGERSRILPAMEESAAVGAFSVSVFDCDAPLHTSLLEYAVDELRSIFSDYCYNEPSVPLLEHISQTCVSASDIPIFLLNELLQPVWWERSYRTALAMGATSFVEVGTGNALKKFNRWIDTQP